MQNAITKDEMRKVLIDFRDGKIGRDEAMDILSITIFGGLVSLMYREKIFMKTSPSYRDNKEYKNG